MVFVRSIIRFVPHFMLTLINSYSLISWFSICLISICLIQFVSFQFVSFIQFVPHFMLTQINSYSLISCFYNVIFVPNFYSPKINCL